MFDNKASHAWLYNHSDSCAHVSR